MSNIHIPNIETRMVQSGIYRLPIGDSYLDLPVYVVENVKISDKNPNKLERISK